MNLIELLIKSAWARQRDERGATAVEYGLMVTLIAVVIIAGVTTFGVEVSKLFLVPAESL